MCLTKSARFGETFEGGKSSNLEYSILSMFLDQMQFIETYTCIGI
jgi:hypothetical protein